MSGVAPERASSARRSREVIAEHLRLRRAGELERDLRENYAPDVVVLTARQVFRGHDGVGASAHRLWQATAGGTSPGQPGVRPVPDPARMAGLTGESSD